MAYNEKLAGRIRLILAKTPDVSEKKMFGGIGFLLHGNMTCGVLNDDLIVRVGPARYENALARPRARRFDITGRVMKGWVMVAEAGSSPEEELAAWVRLGVSFARSLPEK